ncbi:MAG: hypothetical protein FWD83_10295, partial [Promicromonosporaceae bacterium]|nr:hypothetical protein [Promicromonosporaceae bacterium]
TPPPPTPTPTPPTPIPTPPTPTPTPPAPTTPNHLAPTGIDGAQAMALLLVAALFITTGALAMLIIRQRHLPKHLQ